MYTVHFKKSARKEFESLPRKAQEQLAPVIRELSAFPNIRNVKKLTNQPGYRVRSGDYRILFLVQDGQIIMVTAVGDRKDIYR